MENNESKTEENLSQTNEIRSLNKQTKKKKKWNVIHSQKIGKVLIIMPK